MSMNLSGKKYVYPFLLGAVLALSVGCNNSMVGHVGQTTVATPKHEGEVHEIHWTYEGESGSAKWGELDPAFALCGKGKQQTPIDITNAEPKKMKDIIFHYKPTKVDLVNTGHTIQINYPTQDNSIIVDGMEYKLVQFHFHTPSEHTFSGKALPMEIHLVHRNEAGNYAVVGVMMKEGKDNKVLTHMWAKMPANKSVQSVNLDSFDATSLLPIDKSTYRYIGSLTIPPCSEGFKWTVMGTPIEMSREQIKAFQAIYPMNSRPVQPLNDRKVTTDVK